MSLICSVAFDGFGPRTRSHAYIDPHLQPLIHGQRPVTEVPPSALALQTLDLFGDLTLGMAADVLAPPATVGALTETDPAVP
jgi:hypothetical protein